MATFQRSFSTPAGGWARAFKILADEAGMLVRALLGPNRIISEVEQMRALHVAANGIEAVDPARAAVLRSRASRIGLG